MTDPVLQADLEALERLEPQLQTLVLQVRQGLPHEIPAGGTVDAGAVRIADLHSTPRMSPPRLWCPNFELFRRTATSEPSAINFWCRRRVIQSFQASAGLPARR